MNFLKFLNGDEKMEAEGSMLTRTEEYEEEGKEDKAIGTRIVGIPMEDREYEVFKIKPASEVSLPPSRPPVVEKKVRRGRKTSMSDCNFATDPGSSKTFRTLLELGKRF